MGITAGYNAYEWQQNGVTIAYTSNLGNIIADPLVVSEFKGNEITVSKFGTYRVRFRRVSGGEWSAWSPKPAIITTKRQHRLLQLL